MDKEQIRKMPLESRQQPLEATKAMRQKADENFRLGRLQIPPPVSAGQSQWH